MTGPENLLQFVYIRLFFYLTPTTVGASLVRRLGKRGAEGGAWTTHRCVALFSACARALRCAVPVLDTREARG